MEAILALVGRLGAGAMWAIMRLGGKVPEGARDQIRDTVQASDAQAMQTNSENSLLTTPLEAYGRQYSAST